MSGVHGDEEFLVVARVFHAVFEEVHGFHGIHVGNVFAENPHAVERGLVVKQVVAAGAGGYAVDRREYAFIAEGAVQLEFHVAGAFEFFEDDFVHFAAGVGEGCGDDCERSTAFDVSGCAEEAFGLLEGVGVDTTGEHFAAGGGYGVVGAGEAGDGVEEDDDVVTTFYHAFGFFENDAGNFYVMGGWFIEGGG